MPTKKSTGPVVQQESSRKQISIRGARVNNLKNVSVDIPRNALTVVTGPSGSGKSSLAFDTLYAEGQRRFVESLSAYARQFLDRMSKPDVDSITGLPPAVAIQQQKFTKNPRSTVGTTTEVYDYVRLLYGRIGIVIDKDTGEVIRKDTAESVAAVMVGKHIDARMYVMFELPHEHAPLSAVRDGLQAKGFSRVVFGGSTDLQNIEDVSVLPSDQPVYVVVDRVVVRDDADSVARLTDSLEQAFSSGGGRITLRNMKSGADHHFSSRFESATSQTVYVEPEPRLFSFNSPFGACPTCQGFGRSVGTDMNLIIPDKGLSIRRGAIHPFRGETFGLHLKHLINEAKSNTIPIDVPFMDLTPDQVTMVMKGVGSYIGVEGFFRMLEEKSYKTHYRVMLSRYRGYTTCAKCEGSRLRTAARQVFVGGLAISDVVKMTLEDARDHFHRLQLTPYEESVVGQVLLEIQRRLTLLCEIGLEYLTLDRLSHTLSGGESQRINLASSLGSALVGTLYVLDEPSIGLHPRDTERLLNILRKLRGLGNTVVVVEHDMDVMRTADHIIDIGPRAGEHGGEVVFDGSFTEMESTGTSLTAEYLQGKKSIATRATPRKGNGKKIVLHRPLHHNLKGDNVTIPLGTMTVITGVSGSGKSSLVHDVLYGNVQRMFGAYAGETGHVDRIDGLEHITGIEMIDQSPIGRSTRSTPTTYIKVFDLIRDVFAGTQSAKQLGWKAGHFSFNVAGGRCEMCEGAGTVSIEMQFLPDIELPCESCNGTRYKRDANTILYKGKSIIEVLNMTIDEGVDHFSDYPRIVNKLNILRSVGLGYLRIGQPSTHLSGGEAQRVKLAGHLDERAGEGMLFVFDEPTTGLHVHDVAALLQAFDKLVDYGHTLVVIEHNMHVIASADWLIDIGPNAGHNGGMVVAAGTPKGVARTAKSHTAEALRSFLKRQSE
ncbi:MAG: excinuclease ABC subunit UvrA [Ignavibacteria bacterium]